MRRKLGMRGALLVAMLAMAGCASVAKVDSGQRTVGDRLGVTLDGAWNQINAPGLPASEVWTMEGLPVDQLLFYTGIKDGQPVKAASTGAGGAAKDFRFRATMRPDEIASLFESVLSEDGSKYTLAKLEPVNFAGEKGFRFEYALVRKVDNVHLSGLGYGAVHRGELFALVYMAPKLAFFPRHVDRVERIARSATVRD